MDIKHNHKMTYWLVGALDQYNQPTWGTPVTVDVRWEDSQRLFITEDGREARGKSTVYMPQGYVYLGDYVALGTFVSASPDVDAFEVRDARSISNLRGTRTEYRVIV